MPNASAPERRFYRGMAATVCRDSTPGFVERRCADCGGATMDYPAAESPRCFPCSNARNPFAQKNIRMSVDACGQPSSNPARVADGTADYNMALPDVRGEVIGKDAYGQIKRSQRPVHGNEVSSIRSLKEAGRRAGLTLQEIPKRAVGDGKR